MLLPTSALMNLFTRLFQESILDGEKEWQEAAQRSSGMEKRETEETPVSSDVIKGTHV